MTNLFGAYDSRDLTGVLLTDYTENQALADIRRFQAQYEGLVSELIADLVNDTTNAKGTFGLRVGGELQPYNEVGETEATRQTGSWDVAYPLERKRDRKMYTEERLVTITVNDLEKDVLDSFAKDFETMQRDILRSFMLKTNYTYLDREFPGSNLGNLAVVRLANNDSAAGSIYDQNGVQVDLATAQNYIGSNNATLTITPFKTAYAKLRSYGLANDVVVKINANDEDTVRGLTEFKAANNPLIVDPNKIFARVQSSRAIGRLEGAGISCEVQIQPFMPSSYFFMYDRATEKPVVRRQQKLTQFQGFRLVQDETRADYGKDRLLNKRWERIQGFGVRNRFNGVAVQIVASATYTDPSTL